MDFRTVIGDQSFGVRVSALLVQEGQIYLARSADGEYYLLGGALEVGEDTVAAMKRELLEEIGLSVAVGPLAFVVENQFERLGRQHHQIEFLYFVEPLEALLAQEINEGSSGRRCEWVALEQLPYLDRLNPAFLKDELVRWDGHIRQFVQKM